MKKSYLGYAALMFATLGGAGVVFSKPLHKPTPTPLRPVRQEMQTQATLSNLLKLDPSADLISLTDVGGKMYGAGRNKIVPLGEDGKIGRPFSTKIAQPSVSSYGQDSVVIADLKAKRLFTLRLENGSLQPLLDLGRVQDPAGEKGSIPNLGMVKDRKLLSVASDGKNVFVAYAAGFSSTILKIDPSTRQVVGRAFAAASDPSAMAFFNGGLYVLVANGSRILKFTANLEMSNDVINLPPGSARGLGIRSGQLSVLKGTDSIARLSIDPRATSRERLRLNLDVVRPIKVVPSRVRFPDFDVSSRYAVLITGDLAQHFPGQCFWNDTVWLYKTLIANGYTKEHIFVLYGDGADFQSLNPYYQNPDVVTDFAATVANVNMVFDGLKNGDAAHGIPMMDINDTLFVWTFDHGGSSDGVSYLCLRDSDLPATAFNAKLNAITYGSRAIFMQQCYSGGFIPGLQNSKTYISTACRAYEEATVANTENETYQRNKYSHGEYNYYITTALNRLRTSPPGGTVDADANGDTFISAAEMHAWMAGHENQPEMPLSADLGGVGSTFKFKK